MSARLGYLALATTAAEQGKHGMLDMLSHYLEGGQDQERDRAHAKELTQPIENRLKSLRANVDELQPFATAHVSLIARYAAAEAYCRYAEYYVGELSNEPQQIGGAMLTGLWDGVVEEFGARVTREFAQRKEARDDGWVIPGL